MTKPVSSSIFHFFSLLVKNREELCGDEQIGNLPFITGSEMMRFTTYKNRFPDMALWVDVNAPRDSDLFKTSGALIELKNSTKSYSVTPFNSTIPSGRKNIEDVGSKIKKDLNAHELKTRHVYYLARGRDKEKTKICLVHGSFFEPRSEKKLIASSFRQVLDVAKGTGLDDKQKKKLCKALANKELFSTHRSEKKGKGYLSVQFRVIVKTNEYGNILSNLHHPEIEDDTLNFVIPVSGRSKEVRKAEACAICRTLKTAGLPQVARKKAFFIKNYKKKYFWVLQIPLK